MTGEEVDARKNVALERYINAKRIEVRCMVKMAGNYFIPSAQRALARMSAAQVVTSDKKKAKDIFDLAIERLSVLHLTVMEEQAKLKEHLKHEGTLAEEATFIDDVVNASMDAMRAAADEIEDLCASDEWSLPTYTEMLFIQCPC